MDRRPRRTLGDALLHVIRSAGTKDEHGPARRQTLHTVLAAAGPRTPALDTVLDAVGTDPWLDATLAMVRHELGAGPEPSTAQLLWLVIDGLSTLLDEPDAFADDVASSPLTELLARPGMLTTALSLHHPATREVLRAAAPHLDDPDLTLELRRALTRRSGNPALRTRSGRQARNERQHGDNRRGDTQAEIALRSPEAASIEPVCEINSAGTGPSHPMRQSSRPPVHLRGLRKRAEPLTAGQAKPEPSRHPGRPPR